MRTIRRTKRSLFSGTCAYYYNTLVYSAMRVDQLERVGLTCPRIKLIAVYVGNTTLYSASKTALNGNTAVAGNFLRMVGDK